LCDLLGCLNGAVLLHEQFAERIEQIRANPELTGMGQRRQIAALVSELRNNENFQRYTILIVAAGVSELTAGAAKACAPAR
jgi:hypothetical protein